MKAIENVSGSGRTRRVTLCLVLLALGAGACGDDAEAGSGGSDDGAAGEAGGDGDAAGDGDGDGDGLVTDVMLDEFVDVDPDKGLTYLGEAFELAPGQEGTHCMRVPVPERFRDIDLVLVGMDAELPEYTHHFFMSYSSEPFPGDGDEPVPCVGDEGLVPIEMSSETAIGGGKIVMGAGVGLDGYRAAPNTGRLLRKGGHFVTNHHVINLSGQPADLYSKINLYLKPASEVDYPSNALNCLSTDVNLEPGEAREVTATCLAPIELDLALLGSHMHQHGKKFETRLYDGEKKETRPEVIYTSTDWDSPDIVPVEPIRLRQGDGITFTCHYENTSEASVTYGLGVDSEMCAFMGGFTFPQDQEPQGLPPSLGTLIGMNEVPTMLIDTTGISGIPF